MKDGEKAKASATVGIFFVMANIPEAPAIQPRYGWYSTPTPELRARKPQSELASVYFAKNDSAGTLDTVGALPYASSRATWPALSADPARLASACRMRRVPAAESAECRN